MARSCLEIRLLRRIKPARVLMRNKNVLILSGIIVLLIGFVLYQEHSISELKTEPVAVASQEEVNDFTLQQQCAQEAAKFFPASLDAGAINTSYTNYYNPQMNKCLVDVYEQVPNKSVSSGYDYNETLWDINSSDIYGIYVSDSPVAGSDLTCYVGNMKCSTLNGFHSLITQKYGIAEGNNLP
jgi:hypothetical protein